MMDKQLIVVIVLISCISTSHVHAFDLGGLLQTTGDVVKVLVRKAQAVVENVPQIFSPEQLLEFSKQSIIGLPAEAIFATINQICSIGQLSKATVSEKPVNINDMNYILMTEQKKVTIPLLKSDLLWKNKLFKKSYNTVILVTGWTSNVKKQGSHRRAWELYAETVYRKTEKGLMAVKCNSLLSITTGGCAGTPIPLGFACPKTAKGSFYLKTNDKPPFGLAL
uniref:Peptidase S1 domain-containing protein n=1 Tax=Anopheles culicifacies TaxID=139723 RepID=A0A182LSH6_9DIPT